MIVPRRRRVRNGSSAIAPLSFRASQKNFAPANSPLCERRKSRKILPPRIFIAHLRASERASIVFLDRRDGSEYANRARALDNAEVT